MSAARSAVFAILCFSVCAAAQTRTLAVYSGNVNGLDSLSRNSLELELQRVLSPAGINVVWRGNAEADTRTAEVGYLVVGSFSGNCSVETASHGGLGSSATKTLADTSVQNQRILPYFRVDCARIFAQLAPVLDHVSAPLQSSLLGRAIARVIAHEVYHILAQTAEHAEEGLAKPQFSLQDLTASRFDLNSASLHRLQAAVGATSTVRSGGLASLD